MTHNLFSSPAKITLQSVLSSFRWTLLILALLLAAASLSAQTAKTPPLWCQEGGLSIVVQGLASTGPAQVSMPLCTVTVYNTGTNVLATIYSNGSGGTLSNPFTANSDGSYSFWASTASQYDIVTVGTTYCVPLLNGCSAGGTITTTVTLVDVAVQGGGGSGGGITGATANGGLVVTGTTLGLILTCSSGNALIWNGTAWACGSPGGTGSSSPGQLLWNSAGSVAGVCSYDGISTLTCVNLTATNINITGQLTVAGAYQILNSPNATLSCPSVGFTNFGVGLDHYLQECIGGSMTQPADLIYQTNPSALDAGEPFVGALGTTANPGATSVTAWVDVYTACGSTDLGAAIAACKILHFNDGVQLDARSFNIQGAAIKWGTSDYVSGYTGPPILLPQGTINVQGPNLVFMQARTDMRGMGIDSTDFQVCISGNLNCNGVFFPTSATTPTYCVVGWTDDGITCNFNYGGIQDAIMSGFAIDGQSNPGLICLANFVGEEHTGPQFYAVHGCGNHSVSVGFGGAFVQVAIGAPLQSNSTTTSTACTNCALPLPSAQVAGDTVPTCGMWKTSAGSPSLSTITDTASNPYSLVSGSLQTDGLYTMQCGYAQNINAAPSGQSIKYNFSAATASYFAAEAAEWKNMISLGTIDQVAVAVVTTSAPACPSITPTKNNELVTCWIEAETSGATFAAGTTSGCAASACQLVIGTALQGMEYVLQSTAAAIALNWTSATTRRAIVVSMSFVPGTNNGPGSQNSLAGPGNIYINRNETSTSDSVLMAISTGVVGEAGPAYIGPHTTVTVNSGFVGTAPTNIVDILDGTGMVIETMHVESANASSACGLRVGAGAGVKGLQVDNLNSGQMNTAGALLCISNVGNSSGVKFTNLNAVGANYPTNLIADSLTGCTDPISNESIISDYEIGSQGSTVGGYLRLSSSNYPGCQTTLGSLLYQIDDPMLCHVYTSGGGGAQNCTNSSLTNPTPGEALILTAFPPSTASITVTDNGIGPHTVGFIQIVSGTVVNGLLSTTCTPLSTFAPTYLPYMTGSVPYVSGSTLGTMTFTMGSSYTSGPVCVAIRLTGYDQ